MSEFDLTFELNGRRVTRRVPNEARLRSGHGSLTADEMHVPLLAARGGGGRGGGRS